ncbi:MAG: carboxy terminal-processing peptidase [Myxococcales bacterium]|nr:carboxy terminal-processing peptidase [Myxococcales bacterium]
MPRHRRLALVLLLLSGCSSTPGTPRVDGTAGARLPSGAPPVLNLPPAAQALEDIPPDSREELLAKGVEYLLQHDHLSQKAVDDTVSAAAFENYVAALDGGKLFLLKEHVAALAGFADLMDDEIRDGDLLLGRKGAALLARRREVVGRLIAELCAAPFDYAVDEQLETDPKKVSFAASEAELRDRWRRVLKLQVLERVAQMQETAEALAERNKPPPPAGSSAPKPPVEPEASAEPSGKPPEPIPATFEGREAKARADVATSYATRFVRLATPDPLDPSERFLNSIASVYDPHSVYMPPAEEEDFDIQITGSLQGIGAALGEENHYIAVREIIPGSASWLQGELEVGDLILAVAQDGKAKIDVTDMPIKKVVAMIRGPKGTVVTLTVKKPDGRIVAISITRDIVKIEASYARGAMLGAKKAGAGGAQPPALGYIQLPGFYGELRARPGADPSERNATDDVKKLLDELERQKVPGVIIDLRGNGGGLLEHARGITGLLIDEGPVVQTRSPDGEHKTLADKEPGVSFTGEVVVLIDKFSASASEILAAALQDYRRAVLVGTSPTHGKGTVQTVFDLDRLRAGAAGPSLGVFKVTIQQFYRVNGESTQVRGVTPDVLLPDPAAYIESGERFLEHAIPWNRIDPVPFVPVRPRWDGAGLAAASAARQAAEPMFGKIDAYAKLLKAQRDVTLEPLAKDAWLAERKRHTEALKAALPKLSEGPARFEVTPVGAVATPPRPTRPGDKPAPSRLDRWGEELARDPWVAEALQVLADMTR